MQTVQPSRRQWDSPNIGPSIPCPDLPLVRMQNVPIFLPTSETRKKKLRMNENIDFDGAEKKQTWFRKVHVCRYIHIILYRPHIVVKGVC